MPRHSRDHYQTYVSPKMALIICFFYFTALLVTIHVLVWPDKNEFQKDYASNIRRSNFIERAEAFFIFPKKPIAPTKINRINHCSDQRNDGFKNQECFIIRAESSPSSSEEISEDRLLLERLHAKLYQKNRNNYYNIQGNINEKDKSSSSGSDLSPLSSGEDTTNKEQISQGSTF